MRKVVLNQALTMRLSEPQRQIIEDLANKREIALGEAARYIIDAGLKSLSLV
jgi:hypothetical protein